ncbi:MAG: Rieske (2Fe-2S) protein [Gemmatimonadetes bacterium]|nr:Rieske (2Fe-2S) protein [Gemmatimonadota bacterium]
MELKVIPEARGAGEDGCEGCGGGTTRRDFLRNAAGLAAGALAALGLLPEHAGAFAADWATPIAEAGSELTLAIPTMDGAAVYKDHGLILARHAGAVYAFSLACPHQRAALRWREADARFQCPKHRSRYRPDGGYISGRATRSMDRFALRREGNNVVVNLSRLIREDQDRVAWAGAAVRLP